MTEIALVARVLSQFISFYLVLLTIRVLLSWFPNVNWMDQPFAALGQITDPYLNLFRSIIPPLGGIDFSPILGFFLLQFIAGQVAQVAQAMIYRASIY